MADRSPRGSLSKSILLDAALELIDRGGVENLSIRGLAKAVGRPPMSLYSHFRSKRELLDLAHERLLEHLMATKKREDWVSEFEASSAHVRELLLAHPHWIALLTRVRVPAQVLAFYDRMLDHMTKAGFRPEAAFYAFSAVMSHALGSVLVERMLGGSPPVPQQRLAAVKAAMSDVPAGAYPRVAAALPQFDRWTFRRVFDVGCHALVTGLDECMPRRGGRHRRRGPTRITMARLVGA